jgi:hypothetical protein
MMDNCMPEPILFNCWKHHQEFILQEIRKIGTRSDLDSLRLSLKLIGDSTTDLYTGSMSLQQIAAITISFLKQNNLGNEAEYLSWISESPDQFKTKPYPDQSVWVFKIGIEPGRYVHIHPGRNVPHTVRAKANVLKTAIAVNARALIDDSNPLRVENINAVREELIDLDPIKFVTMNQELGRLVYHFAVKLGTLET